MLTQDNRKKEKAVLKFEKSKVAVQNTDKKLKVCL